MEQEELTVNEINQKVLKLSIDLINTPTSDSRVVSFPKDKGIYIWRAKGGEVIYIGVGNGRNGLSGRIKDNHLAPGYSKSVFRIKVAKEYGLEIGRECVEFICDNFRIAFVPYPDKYLNEAAEALLIAAFRPKYNA